MLATEHTQSLTDFRAKAGETLDRLNQTGEAEIITVNGEARAVLLSPARYDAMARELSRDAEVIKRSLQEYEAGDSKELHEFLDEVRAKLLSMKAAKANGNSK